MKSIIFLLRHVLLVRLVCVFFLAILPHTSSAFGLKTHIWIGQKIIGELHNSCRVSIHTISASVNRLVCQSIRNNPQAFLSGVLGPDAFPDMITGQVTTHPGIDNDWQTNDWLIHLYANAKPGPELAFAAGYVVHAASDIFAHSYVNAYSGDIFILSDERAVERRHFVLEKYIDSKLPGFQFSDGMLNPPTEFLRDKLIHNADASRLAQKSNFALHISAMQNVYRQVNDLARNLDDLEKDAGARIADVAVSIQEANAKIITGESQLKLLRETLSANEAKLNAQKQLYDAANKTLQDAIRKLQENKDKINLLGIEAKAERDAAEAAGKIGSDAVTEIANLHNQISNLQNQILNTPANVSREICSGICSSCPNWLPCDIVCEPCRIVQQVNEAYTNLTGQLNSAQQALTNAQARVAQAGVDAAKHAANEAAKLKEQASEAALTAGLDAAKTAAQAAYDVQKANLDLQSNITLESRKKVDELTAEIAKLRNQLVDFQSIKEALAEIISRSEILSGYAKNWVYGMDVAGKEYIVASHQVGHGMIQGQSNFFSTYLDWWKCYGNAYTAIPVQFGQATCEVQNFLEKMENEANKIIERNLPPPFNELYGRYLKIKYDINAQLRISVSDAAIQFAKLVSPDPTTGDFIELLAKPENATRDKLNSVFATADDAAGKQLLLFPSIADSIDADMHLKNGTLNPQTFLALRNALTLSKLSLMDASAIKGIVWVIGGDPSQITVPSGPGRKSVLFSMVRSIDGNHQWQPYGLPYARSAGKPVPEKGEERRYGYGPGQMLPGFEMYINPKLRDSVFLKLFEGPINGGLAKHPDVLGKYPFPECEANPFPVAFNPDGTPAAGDDRCTKGTAFKKPEAFADFWRRAVDKLRLNPYDPL